MKNTVFILISAYFILAEGAFLRDVQNKKFSPPKLTDTRIVGGSEVDISRHPHQISMRAKSILSPGDPYRHSCGGSIISSTYILTAAHCIIGTVASQILVVAGSNNRRGSDGVAVPVEKMLMHNGYDSNTFNYDVALLKLPVPLPLNNLTIRAIELADKSPNPGMMATATGWGRLTEGGVAPETLQEVNVPIVSRSVCSDDYGPKINITDAMLCAGYRGVGGKDSCQNDSGGPLIVNGKLTGIISWGFGCGRPEYPGVYADVAHVREWINDGIRQLEEGTQ